MKIAHKRRGEGGRFIADTPHGLAELDYEASADGAWVIVRTYVPPPARGRGLAEALVEAAVEAARAAGAKIIPECSYAARLFDRRKDWSPLRA